MPEPRLPIDTAAFVLDFPTGGAAVAWTEIFGNDHPVELEVGSGKGLFLANAARANPGRNFLGVEISKKYARLAAERLAYLGGDLRLDIVEHRLGKAAGIRLRLDHQRRHRADQNRLLYPALSMTRKIADHFAAPGGVPNVDRMFQIKMFG